MNNENVSGKSNLALSADSFLPVCVSEVKNRGWNAVDFIFVTGDAYVDHPSFGGAIITRLLESRGFKVAVLSQPDLSEASFCQFGRPIFGFFVTSGNIDSMVAHYTVAKKRRTEDNYSPGGKIGKRPDRAVLAYCATIRKFYTNVPIVIGGLEASLRRFAHYDYWADAVMPSVLVESGADILVYGMGENQTIEIAGRLKNGEHISTITDVKGTCYLTDVKDTPFHGSECPSFANVLANKREYAVACRIQHSENDHVRGKLVKQRHGSQMLVQNSPMPPLTTFELDNVYSLPYMRTYHPDYISRGGVPAIEEVAFSVTHNRGCFGDCNFCSLAFHQGRFVSCRSKRSIIEEVKLISKTPAFKGYIHDVGGPTANFRIPSCTQQLKSGLCKNKKCLAPEPCKSLKVDHSEYLDILRTARALPGIKKVFVRSGIRYDYLIQDEDSTFFKELVSYHTSGQLKVAPEHCSASVLDYMGKPHIEAYLSFSKKFYEFSKKAGKEQYLVPYLISSHPGSTLEDAIELALFLKRERIRPEQVQDFYPTPATVSTCMFYTGLDPYTLKDVYVARNSRDKAAQRALLQYFYPKNKPLVIEALKKAGRTDLIGDGDRFLVSNIKTDKNAGSKGMNYGGGRHNNKQKN